MGLAASIKRVIATITPNTMRPAGGTFLSCLPRAAPAVINPGTTATWVALQAGAVGGNFGAAVALGTPTADYWVEEILFMENTAAATATGPCVVGLFTATGIPTAIGPLVSEVAIDIPATPLAVDHRAKVYPPAYFPGGTILCAALECAGVANGKLNVMAVISFNKAL